MQESERSLGREMENEWRVSASVAVLLRLGHFHNRLLLVQRRNGQWGLPAGKVEQGEFIIESVAREVYEETGIGDDVPFEILDRPDVVSIPEEGKTKLGLVFSASYAGKRLSLDGWKVEDPDEEIVCAQPFTLKELMNLIDNPEKINRPEFNLHQIMKFLISYAEAGVEISRLTARHKGGRIGYLDRWLEKQYEEKKIPGLFPDGPPWSGYHGWCYQSPYDLSLPGQVRVARTL